MEIVMSWRALLAFGRLPCLVTAMVLSAMAAKQAVLHTQDNRDARAHDRHLARPARMGCARIADDTWALDRARTAGETFPFTVWLESTGQGPCRAQVSLDGAGFALEPPGHHRGLTVTGRDGDATWDLTAARPGAHELEIRSLGTAALLGFVVRAPPLVPVRQAVPAAAVAWLLAFTVGIPHWLERRRWRREEEEEHRAWEEEEQRAAGG
jgi:hypothetical protein